MKFKYILTVTVIVTTSLLSCNGQKGRSAVKLKSQTDSVSYAIGMSLGENFKKDKLDSLNLDILNAAIHSVLAGDSMALDSRQSQMCIQNYFMAKQKKEGEANLAKGKQFLEQNSKKPGVKTLPDGLQYEVVKDGTGPKPKETDTVEVHYHGTLIDGTVFDSSVERGQPAQFPVNRVIPGWTEAMQMMAVGSKWKLYIPANLAYGEHGQGKIGPNSVLIFDVELLRIVH
jgi:FKBP-type peptidyl-prolyl cis-trans isomerase FklB